LAGRQEEIRSEEKCFFLDSFYRTYQGDVGLDHVVSIVGIDEVDLDRGYISWRSPLANALMKASPGDRVELRAPAKTERLEIINVEYAPIPMDPFREPLGAESTPKVEGS